MKEVNNRCGLLFPFFLKELPPEELRDFRVHLAGCVECEQELKELSKVWYALVYEMDEVEPPESQKAAMLECIINEIKEQDGVAVDQMTPVVNNWPQTAEAPARRWMWWPLAAASILCLIVGAAVGWGVNEYGRVQLTAGGIAAEPAQVVGQYALKAFDPEMPAASGNCLIKQQGKMKQLVIQVNGLGPNKGEQAYQLWIVKQGTRYNGGTFRVDDEGNGVLTHELNPLESPFETIGITLEPDSLGIKPRGKKVLGT